MLIVKWSLESQDWILTLFLMTLKLHHWHQNNNQNLQSNTLDISEARTNQTQNINRFAHLKIVLIARMQSTGKVIRQREITFSIWKETCHMPWNLNATSNIAEEQAAVDRVHSIGQSHDVRVLRLDPHVCDNLCSTTSAYVGAPCMWKATVLMQLFSIAPL